MSARDEMVLDAVAGKRPSRTGWVRGNCPFCEMRVGSPDRKGCLGLDVETGKWHCFRCSAMGLVQEAELEDLDTRTAERPRASDKPPIELPEGFVPLYDGSAGALSWFADGARDYLEHDRKLSRATLRSARVGACFGGKYRNRVVVPIFDADDRVLAGWSARLYAGGGPLPSGWTPPKYLYPPGMDRQTLLYNAAALRVDTPNPVFVVEGVFDALPLWPDGVGCLGKPSPGQLEALVNCRRPIVALLDGDAWRASFALWVKLRARRAQRASWYGTGGAAVHWHRLPPKTDPGATDPATLRAAAAQALREVA